jgi:NTE family protein
MRWTLRRPAAREDVVGLVISGGGSRSSFQIGALRYLYDREGISPTVITGTSAGSILAAVLAQSAEGAGQRRALAELERIWLGMRQDSDMFTEQEWYARLRERGPAWARALSRQQRQQHRRGTLGRTFARVASLTGGRGTDGPGTDETVASTTTPDSAATPDSSVDGAASGTGPGPREAVESDQPTAGSSWNPINVVELLGMLREAGRARPDLEVIVRGAQRERSMYRPGPIVDRLLDPAVFAPERVAASGVTLRVAVVALESGELRYVTETGGLVDRHDDPVPGTAPVSLVDALYASCAIPAVFPPVRLGEEHYVDGGVRETLPAEIAVEHLGVTRCFAVVASPPGVPHQDSYADKDMLAIVLRSTAGIMSDEALHDEVSYAHRAGATVIVPELDVHDALTIDPGLVTIAMDYGYLRAAEVCAGASADERQLVRDLVTLRREAWALESDLFGPAAGAGVAGPAGPEPDLPDLTELVALKHRLRALVDQAPQEWLPPGAQEWWRTFERHPWEPPVAPSWAG